MLTRHSYRRFASRTIPHVIPNVIPDPFFPGDYRIEFDIEGYGTIPKPGGRQLGPCCVKVRILAGREPIILYYSPPPLSNITLNREDFERIALDIASQLAPD